MLPFISQVNLIRYLIVWQVSGPFVQLPRHFAPEISQTLGALIAESLPTQQARSWRKVAESWGGLPGDAETPAAGVDSKPKTRGASQGAPAGARTNQRPPLRFQPDAAPSWPAWPIEAVIWPYPGKRGYGQGELILWELKLLGNDADHGVFLELILPAMEAAATTSDERWHRQRTLWGRFDIQSVYVSRGPRWEQIVHDRRLDLSYRATPAQWAEGLMPDASPKHRQRRLTWLTPFDLGAQETDVQPLPETDEEAEDGLPALRIPRPAKRTPAPGLRDILDALMARLAPLALGKRATAEQAWALLTPEERMAVWLDCDEGRLAKVDLQRSDKDAPGRWIGEQTFTKIPPRLAPYLELAATLHLGQHTHFGCGTFTFA
jgi:hypothetical protein